MFQELESFFCMLYVTMILNQLTHTAWLSLRSTVSYNSCKPFSYFGQIPSRSARRKKAKRRWLREQVKAEKKKVLGAFRMIILEL
jgi:hypothetical protein